MTAKKKKYKYKYKIKDKKKIHSQFNPLKSKV